MVSTSGGSVNWRTPDSESTAATTPHDGPREGADHDHRQLAQQLHPAQ